MFGQGQPQIQPPTTQPPVTKPLPPAEFRWEIAGGLLLAIALIVAGVLIWLRRHRPEDAELDPL